MTKTAMPDSDDVIRRLVSLDLTLNEARCYVGLLHTAPTTAGELADFAGVPRPKVYAALRTLEQRSFCYASGEPRVTTFRPVDPELALGEWVRGREHERRLADERERQVAAELVELLPNPDDRVVEDVTSIMELTGGPEPTSRTLEQLIGRTERRVDIINSLPVIQAKARWNRFELAALERGVRVRMLFATADLAIDHRYEELLEAGGEVRLARGNPPKLIVRDDGAEALVALFNPDDTRHPTCAVIKNADVVAPLQLLFNREWRRARPYGQPSRPRTR